MNRLLNRLFRAAPIVLALYWTALFISTHYPLNVPLEAAWRHTDKLLHFAAFFGLAVLCAAAWTWRIRLAARHHLLLLAGLLVYAAVDEGLQAIPTFQRSANLADFAANVAGVVVGLAVFAILRRFARERLGWKLHRPQDPAEASPEYESDSESGDAARGTDADELAGPVTDAGHPDRG